MSHVSLQVFGEITSHADVDYDAVARQVCHDIGYNHDVSGISVACPGACQQTLTASSKHGWCAATNSKQYLLG